MVFKRPEIRQEADAVALISRGTHAGSPKAGTESGIEKVEKFLIRIVH